jgi:hypothetical protein
MRPKALGVTAVLAAAGALHAPAAMGGWGAPYELIPASDHALPKLASDIGGHMWCGDASE